MMNGKPAWDENVVQINLGNIMYICLYVCVGNNSNGVYLEHMMLTATDGKSEAQVWTATWATKATKPESHQRLNSKKSYSHMG